MSYPDNAPASRDLYERAKGYLLGGNTRRAVYMRPIPIYAARGFLPLAMCYFDQADRRLTARSGSPS